MNKHRVLALAVCMAASALCPAQAYEVHKYAEGLARPEQRATLL